MKLRLFIIIAALACSTAANAQGLGKSKFGDDNGAKSTTDTTRSATTNVRQVQTLAAVGTSSNYYTECYEKIVNRNGLWKGVGTPLTPTQAKHKNAYYKLMRPQNAAPNSPFTKMQIVDFAGNLSTDLTYEPYIGDADGSKIDFSKVCQAEKIFWQGRMVQENMYDADGNLVTQFLVTPLSENEVMGHFINPDGVMPKVRDEEEYTYIYIKYDDNGFVSQIAFYNEHGTIVKNNDDAFKKLYVYDKNGNQLSNMSGDASGNPIIDNWGNSGYSYTYDSKGRCLTATCINHLGEPINMPSSRSSSRGVCKTIYTYDQWGNQTSCSYFDVYGVATTNPNGVHRFVSAYDDMGHKISYRALDPNGQLVNYSKTIAMYTARYDKDGNMVFKEFRDENGRFTTDGDCLWIREYKNGKRVLYVDYNSTTGLDTVMNYKRVDFAGGDTIWNIASGYINVELKDEKDRMTYDAYYDLDGNPKAQYGYHKIVYRYTDGIKHSIRETRYLDTKGNPMDIHDEDYGREYNVRITEVDSVNRIMITTELDGDRIIDKWANPQNEDYSAWTGLMYYDSLGIRGRSFKSDGFYYRMERVVDAQGNTYSYQAFNEFDEPAYNMRGDWDNAIIYSLNILEEANYRDENGDTIPSDSDQRKEFKNSLYKAFIIELIDSTALKLGLMTGDVLVRYGDWIYVNPRTSGGYWRNILCYEMIRKANTNKTAIVMRHDPVTKTSRLIELNLPEGTPQQLGFLYHAMIMTEKETKRYNNVIAEGLQSAIPDYSSSTDPMPTTLQLSYNNCDFADNDRVDFIFPCKIGSKTNTQVFRGGFKQNAVVLGWEPYLNGSSHFYSCHNENEEMEDAFERNYDSIVLHYTADGRSVLRYTFYDDDFRRYVIRSNTRCPDASAFYALADSLQEVFAQRESTRPQIPSLKPHEAAEQLLTLKGSEKTGDDLKSLYLWIYDEFTNVSDIYEVSYETDSLTFDDIRYAKGILSNIDLSEYTYLEYIDEDGEPANEWVMINKNKITEIVRVREKGLLFFIGDGIGIPRKTLTTIKYDDDEEDGYFYTNGLDGNYILLRLNQWRLGNDFTNFTDGDRSEPWPLYFVPVPKEGDKRIGKVTKLNMHIGDYGIRTEDVEVSDEVYFDALNKARKLK